MAALDPYRVLGVPPQASDEDLKSAWRKAARAAHPDLGGSTAAMTAVNLAWELLGTPQARAAFEVERLPQRPAPRAYQRPAPTMPFGKYEGETLAWVAAYDPGYIRWALRSASAVDGHYRLREDLIDALNARPRREPPPPKPPKTRSKAWKEKAR